MSISKVKQEVKRNQNYKQKKKHLLTSLFKSMQYDLFSEILLGALSLFIIIQKYSIINMKIVGEKYLKFTNQFRHLHHTLHIPKIKTIMKAQKSDRHFEKQFPQYPIQYKWNYENVPLHAYTWQPAHSPKALLVNFNALNAHTGLSGSMAEKFAECGIIMSGFDYPNFGKSYSPEPGHIQSIENLIKISQQFLKHSVQKYPGIPVFLNGLSMGGLIAFHIGQRKAVPINGCILLNPAFRDNPLNNGLLKKIVMYSGMLFPKFQTMKPIRSSSTKHSLQKYKNVDKNMYSGRVWTSTTWALLSHMKNTAKQQRFSQFDVPFLCVQGGTDKVLYPFTVFELQQSCRSKDKQIVIIPDLWHALWFDDHHDQVVEMVKIWINQRIKNKNGINNEEGIGDTLCINNKKMSQIGRHINHHHSQRQEKDCKKDQPNLHKQDENI